METQPPPKKQKIGNVILSILSKVETKSTEVVSTDHINNLPEEILLMILDKTDVYIFAIVLVCKKWLRVSIDTYYVQLGFDPVIRYKLSYDRFFEYADSNHLDPIIPIEHVATSPKIYAEDRGFLFLTDRMIIENLHELFEYMDPSLSRYKPWWLPHLAYHNRLDMLRCLKKWHDRKRDKLSFYDTFGDRSFLLAFLYADILGYQDIICFLVTIFIDNLEFTEGFEYWCKSRNIQQRHQVEAADDHNRGKEEEEETESLRKYDYDQVLLHVRTYVHNHFKFDNREKSRACYEGHIALFSFFKKEILKSRPYEIDLLYSKAIIGDRYDMLEFLFEIGEPSEMNTISLACVRSRKVADFIAKNLQDHIEQVDYETILGHIVSAATLNDAEDLLDKYCKEWCTNKFYAGWIIRNGTPRLIAVLLQRNPAYDAIIPADHPARAYLDPKKYPRGIPKQPSFHEDRMFIQTEEGFYMNVMV